MPALVKSSVGSSCGTSDELGTMRCPFCSKYLRNDARISLEVIRDLSYQLSAVRCQPAAVRRKLHIVPSTALSYRRGGRSTPPTRATCIAHCARFSLPERPDLRSERLHPARQGPPAMPTTAASACPR